MGSLSIWHWIVVIAVVLLLFGRGKISDLMGDVAQGIKAFKKGMQDDDKTAEKPEPVKTIDHNATSVARRRGRMSAARLSEQPACGTTRGKTGWGDAGGPNLVRQVLGRNRLARAEFFMFDIGWSELVVIAVVALIAIGPKELPGVLRMVGQWMGKARKMAAEFQGQFQEAMREAEMADLKKSFDEVKEAATGFTSGNLMTSLQKDVSKALRHRRHRQAGGVRRRCQVAPAIERARHADDTGDADPGNLHRGRGACRGIASRWRSRRKLRRSPRRRTPRPQRLTSSRTPKRHERRGYRGQQGAADGSLDRAALAADQGAARLRRRLHLLLLLRQADLQRAGLAVRLGRRRRRIRSSSTRRCWNISSPS